MKLQAMVRQPEAVRAAVQNGADEIVFSTREGTMPVWVDALAYCRLRGIKTILDLAYNHTDAEIAASAGMLAQLFKAGLFAVSACDLGVLHMAQMISEDIELHADKLFMTAGDLNTLAGMGVKRVVLPPGLTREQVAFIAKNSPCEVGVMVMGRACSALGVCRLNMSQLQKPAVYPCPEPCRKMYGFSGKADTYPLSARDVCLLGHMNELAAVGVAVVRTDGGTPEQAALYTRMAKDAMDGKPPEKDELDALALALSRPGYSDGYYMNTGDIYAPPETRPLDAAAQRMLNIAHETYTVNAERPIVPVRFMFLMRANEPARLAVDDYCGHTVTTAGPMPNPAYENALLEAEANTQWYKTQGTPYKCESARSTIEDEVSLPYALLHEMRREVLEKLSAERVKLPSRETGEFKPGVRMLPRREKPLVTVQVTSLSQLSAQLTVLNPERFYVPLSEIAESPANAKKLHGLLNGGFSRVTAVIPHASGDDEMQEIRTSLMLAGRLGVKEVLCSALSHAALAQSLGFTVRGDLDASNAQMLKELKRLGFESCLLSPQLRLTQMRDFSHVIDTEFLVYGRIPQIVTSRCTLKQHIRVCCCENRNELTDENGNHLPLTAFAGHRNILYDSRKLWLTDKPEIMRGLGVWAMRLYFTTENQRECVQVLERHMGIGKYEPNSITRGFMLMTD